MPIQWTDYDVLALTTFAFLLGMMVATAIYVLS